MTAKTIFAALLLLSQIHGEAQPYYFRHYQVENGLTNNTVHDCLQDKKGFMWLGTKDGLVRFDGYHFKVFRHDTNDSLSIGSNFLRCIYLDEEGRLYAGTSSGLYRYNDSNETFTVLKKGTEVRAIVRDKKDNIWFIIGEMLCRYNLKTGKQVSFPRNQYFSATSLSFTNNNELWVSTADGFIQKYNEAGTSFTAYNLFSQSPPVTSKWIEKIYCAENNSILIGTSSDGAKIFNPDTKTYKDIITYNSNHSPNHVRDFLEIDSNNYWIATAAGIFIYNKNDGSSINLKKNYNDPFSLSDNAVYTLFKDKEGGIWAGTYFGGINYYAKEFSLFKKYIPGYKKNSISGNAVREICADDYGNIWIGTEDAGLNKLNIETNEITQFKPGGLPNDISYFNIHGLVANGDKLWIGTFEHGLNIMDIRSKKVIKHYNAGSHSLASDVIYTILKTRSGNIYIGTPRGAQLYDSTKDQFISLKQIPESFVMCLYEDKEGTVWAGTMDHGVYFVNPKTNKSGNFYNNGVNAGSTIPGNFIVSIFEDSQKNMWIGTEGEGVWKYNREKKIAKVYNLNSGFPSNTVLKVLEDSTNKLWITTTKGLIELNPSTDNFKIYTKSNGLLTDQFNYNSGYQDKQGNIYLGGLRGMISFTPSSITESKYTPPVYITGIQINNQGEKTGDENAVLKQSILYTGSIELAHDQSSINFDFAAISFVSPETISYAYKLERFDKNWTYLATNREVYYTQLPPGKYVFKVKTFSKIHGWNTPEATMNIIIHPSIWASPIAYTIYGAVALSIIILIAYNYHKRVAEKNKRLVELLHHEKEKEIYESKIEFFTNVAHEIRTPLTLIKAPLEKIMKKVHSLPDVVRNLLLMERNTNRLIELTNQLLDFRKTETDGYSLNFVKTSISHLLEDLYTNFLPAAERKNLSYKIKLPGEELLAYADVEALKKIVSNLLDNAIKYASKKVFVELSDQEAGGEFFFIKIFNDGVFIADVLKEKIFEPFYRLRATEHINGTGIGLALTRSLAELHNGNLYVDNSFEDETIFVLKLPMHQKIEFNF